jgi:hypothetical protein
MTLQDTYYYSQVGVFLIQIVLLFIAVGAGIVGYLQLRASNRYELLKILEDRPVREARWLVWPELGEEEKRKKLQPAWWGYPSHSDLEKAASLVCASFDIVALMAKYGNYRFFSREWANSICWTYEALQDYLAHRSKNNQRSYPHYNELYKAAKKHAPWRYTKG